MSRNCDNTSPQYFVRKWRNTSDEEINALDSFLAWLEFDDESPVTSKEDLHDIELLVDQYLHRDEKKIEQGERELLNKWIEAQNDVSQPL